VEIPAEAFFNIVGNRDENLKYFSDIFDIKIFARGTKLIAEGSEESLDKFEKFMEKVASLFEIGHRLSSSS